MTLVPAVSVERTGNKNIVQIKNMPHLQNNQFHKSTKEISATNELGLDQNPDELFPDQQHKTRESQANSANDCLMLSLKAICFSRGIDSGTVLDNTIEFQKVIRESKQIKMATITNIKQSLFGSYAKGYKSYDVLGIMEHIRKLNKSMTIDFRRRKEMFSCASFLDLTQEQRRSRSFLVLRSSFPRDDRIKLDNKLQNV